MLARTRWQKQRWLIEPLLVFFVTRLVLLLLSYASAILLQMRSIRGAAHMIPGNLFLDGWVRWDAVDFLELARQGYWFDLSTGHSAPTLPPVLPLIMAALGQLGWRPAIAALLVSNVAFAAALVAAYRLIAMRGGPAIAGRAIVLLCVFPYAFLVSAAYPQSLVLLFALLAFASMDRRRFWVAAGCAALCALSDPAGLALFPALVVAVAHPGAPRSGWVRTMLDWLSLAIVPAALLAFATYLRDQARFPMAAIEATLFGIHGPSLLAGLNQIHTLTFGRGSIDLLFLVNLIIAAIALLLLPKTIRLLGLRYAVFQAGVILLALAVEPSGAGELAVVAFPIFAAAADLLRHDLAETLAIGGSAFFMALLVMLFANWYPIEGYAEPLPDPLSVAGVTAAYHARIGRTLPDGVAPRDLGLRIDDSILLLGDSLPTTRYRPGGVVPASFYLYVLKAPQRPYLLSIRLTDRSGHEWAEANKALWGTADQPLFGTDTTKLLAGGYLRENLNLRLDRALPPGVYTLDLLVFNIPSFARVPLLDQHGQPAGDVVLSKLIVAAPTDFVTSGTLPVQHAVNADLGGIFTLTGYDLQRTAGPGGAKLQVGLVWTARRPPRHDYSVFVQLLDRSGKLVAQSDSYPAEGRFPTSDLRPGDSLRDVHTLAIPAGTPAGSYQLIAGMYLLKTLQRLPVQSATSNQTADHVVLGELTLP